jgi:hypothetical protein
MPGLLELHPDFAFNLPADAQTFALAGIPPNALILFALAGGGAAGVRNAVMGIPGGTVRDAASATIFGQPIMANPASDLGVSIAGGYAEVLTVEGAAWLANKVVNQVRPLPGFPVDPKTGRWLDLRLGKIWPLLAGLYGVINVQYKVAIPFWQAKHLEATVPFSGGWQVRTEHNPWNFWPSPTGEDASGDPTWASGLDYDRNAIGNAAIFGTDLAVVVDIVLKNIKKMPMSRRRLALDALVGVGMFSQKLYSNMAADKPEPDSNLYGLYNWLHDTVEATSTGIDRSWANPRPEVLRDNVVAAATNGLWSVVGDEILYVGERTDEEFIDDWNRGWDATAPPGGHRAPVAPVGQSWGDTMAAFETRRRNMPVTFAVSPAFAAGVALATMKGEGPGWGATLSDFGGLVVSDYWKSVPYSLYTAFLHQDIETEWAAATASSEAAGERAHTFWRRALETEGVTDMEEQRTRVALNTLDLGAAVVPALWENFKRGIQAPLGLDYETEQADRVGADLGNLRDGIYALWLDSLTDLDRRLLGMPPKTP